MMHHAGAFPAYTFVAANSTAKSLLWKNTTRLGTEADGDLLDHFTCRLGSISVSPLEECLMSTLGLVVNDITKK